MEDNQEDLTEHLNILAANQVSPAVDYLSRIIKSLEVKRVHVWWVADKGMKRICHLQKSLRIVERMDGITESMNDKGRPMLLQEHDKLTEHSCVSIAAGNDSRSL